MLCAAEMRRFHTHKGKMFAHGELHPKTVFVHVSAEVRQVPMTVKIQNAP